MKKEFNEEGSDQPDDEINLGLSGSESGSEDENLITHHSPRENSNSIWLGFSSFFTRVRGICSCSGGADSYTEVLDQDQDQDLQFDLSSDDEYRKLS